ncbi:hypothetical protein [Streptomyces sp. NPDC089799]|uniref:hypothetical protein n=1 Tax=Streptomyces sp. NPDC089799 TaxID=3155066 RepID=UPI003448825C
MWLRDDNTYQLEFRDGTAAEHYQTRTISQEKVIAALSGWADGRPEWKGAFMWNNISAFFADADVPIQPDAPDTQNPPPRAVM